jgi:hypothetical protein
MSFTPGEEDIEKKTAKGELPALNKRIIQKKAFAASSSPPQKLFLFEPSRFS